MNKVTFLILHNVPSSNVTCQFREVIKYVSTTRHVISCVEWNVMHHVSVSWTLNKTLLLKF